MECRLHQVNTIPGTPEPGGVYFELATGLIKVAQEDGSCKEYGGQGVEIIAPDTPGSISTGGSIELKVAKGGSTSVIPLFMQWFDGQELLAMEDGEQKTLTAKLYNMLLTFVANGRNYAFFMVKGAVGMTGTSMIPVTVEFNGSNTLYVKAVLTFNNDPEKPMISTWSLTSGNVATRADVVIGQSGMTVDSGLSDTSTNPIQNKAVSLALKEKASTSVASTSSNGLMSSDDKVKLEGIEEGANKTEFINFDSRWFDSGTIPADVVAKIKEHELPLLVYNSQYDLRHAGSYLWNGTIICVSCFDSQGDSTRIVSAEYNPDGTRISVNRVAIGKSGDGSKFLSDDGTYKAPSVEVDSVLNEASSNPVQNKAVAKAIDDINQDLADLPGIIKTISNCEMTSVSDPDSRYKINISSIWPRGMTLNVGDFVYLVVAKILGRISSISGGYAYIRYDEAFSSMS